MHRLAGDDDLAESAYRDAVAHGHAAHPGLALLRLRQGRVEDAWAAIRRELDERATPSARCVVLPAYVEIAIAADEREAARHAAGELRAIAGDSESAMLHALAGYAAGAVELSDGDPKAAMPLLRRAATAWRELDVPFEVARTRVLIGRACAAVGDRDTAAIEWDAARRTFDDLGALPDLDAMDDLLGGVSARHDRSGLTGREVEVLALVATGMTNRDVAEALVISEKTVARHLSNIFTKIGVSSRAAATAYAIKHGLA
jgi:DNA-binding CsgD family transcriptional regulator